MKLPRIPDRCIHWLLIGAALAGSLLFMQLFAKTTFNYDSFSFTIQPRLGVSGGTVLAIPPVGQLFLESHRIPWEIIITLNQVDLVRLEKDLNSLPPKEAWLHQFQQEALKAVAIFFITTAVVGILGGTLALLIFRVFPSTRLFWYGMAASLLLVLLLLGGTWFTYDTRAIEHPQYRGVLAAAPWAMNLVTMGLDNLEVIGGNLKRISQELPLLYKQAGAMRDMGNLESDLTVLHVSDLHNNPAGLDLVMELIANFKVDLVIDTGDVTDYATALEATILDRFGQLSVPYLFVPGNHDSPLIISRLQQFRHIKVLTDGMYTVRGLTIAAEKDPASDSYSSDVASVASLQASQTRLTKIVSPMKSAPDIVAVHNRILAAGLIGAVPLILHGHDHRFSLSQEKGTTIVDAGTTGAAGLRGLNEGAPYSAAILYWKRDTSGKLRLVAVDSIRINGGQGNLSIERKKM